MKTMTFTVAGVHHYTLKITNRAIYDDNADELDGCALESRRLLLVSHRVDPSRREEVVYHELKHAWLFHVPPPQNDEQRCQLFATIAQSLRQDMDSQGGIQTLLKLPWFTYPPGDTPNSRRESRT